MEKILLVLKAQKPDIASIAFACKIASLAKTKLTGLFLENIYVSSTPVLLPEASFFPYAGMVAMPQINTETAVGTEIEQSIAVFKEECRRRAVAATVCVEKGEPIQKVLSESRYADLLILDPKLDFYQDGSQLPSHFTKEILANAECPVLLSPEKVDEIEEIVFCYDGSASSVFAIKQFTYLFQGLSDRKTVLLRVNKTGLEELDNSYQRMQEWLQAHYPAVQLQLLKGNAKDQLFSYLFKKTGKIIVMGAYGRSLLSTFFRRSNADVLIRTIDMPIFITHQ